MYLNFCHLFQTVLKPLHFSERYCRDWAYHVSQVRISQAFYNLCGTWWSRRLTWTAHSTAQIKSLTTITTLNKTQLNHKLSLAQFCWPSHRNACLHDETHYLPSFFGNSGAGCFLAFLPGPFGVASVDDLFLPMLNYKETTLHKYIFGTVEVKITKLLHVCLKRFAKGIWNRVWKFWTTSQLSLRWLRLSMRKDSFFSKRSGKFVLSKFECCLAKNPWSFLGASGKWKHWLVNQSVESQRDVWRNMLRAKCTICTETIQDGAACCPCIFSIWSYVFKA